jgi:hypothetical protein
MTPGDRPLLWVLATEAAALRTSPEMPEEMRGLSPQQRGGAVAGAKKRAKADRWRIPAVKRALFLTASNGKSLTEKDLIGRVYRHLDDHVFKDNPEDCPNYKTAENYLKSWLKDQMKAASQKPPES